MASARHQLSGVQIQCSDGSQAATIADITSDALAPCLGQRRTNRSWVPVKYARRKARQLLPLRQQIAGKCIADQMLRGDAGLLRPPILQREKDLLPAPGHAKESPILSRSNAAVRREYHFG